MAFRRLTEHVGLTVRHAPQIKHPRRNATEGVPYSVFPIRPVNLGAQKKPTGSNAQSYLGRAQKKVRGEWVETPKTENWELLGSRGSAESSNLWA